MRLGNTENCTGRRIWIAVSSTSTDAVMLSVSSRSRTKLGSGTSITNTSATAPVGMIQSEDARSVSSVQASCSLRPHSLGCLNRGAAALRLSLSRFTSACAL
jgi:hypothetical protein